MSKDLQSSQEQTAGPDGRDTAAAGAGLDGTLPGGAGKEARKRKRQRARFRGAWISFVGRIIAQFVGSAASIVLGIALIERHHSAVTASTAAAPPAAVAPAQALPGPTLLVVPLQHVPRDQQDLLVEQLAAAIRAAVADHASVAVVPRLAGSTPQGDGLTQPVEPGTQAVKPGHRAASFTAEGPVARAGQRAASLRR
jgi:hypothetical protein